MSGSIYVINGRERRFNYGVTKAKVQLQSMPAKLMEKEKVLPVLPNAICLASRLPFDQGNQGCCVNNSFALIKKALDDRYLGNTPDPSRDFGYYCCLLADGNAGQDMGTTLGMCAEVYKSIGVCYEKTWGYSKDDFINKPSDEAFAEATKHKVDASYTLKTEDEVKRSLAAGYLVSFGTAVMKQLVSEDLAKGRVTVIKNLQKKDLLVDDQGNPEGHCMTIVGYNDKVKAYQVQNSWGADWCAGGRCWIAYDVIHNPAWVDEIVTLRLAKEKL